MKRLFLCGILGLMLLVAACAGTQDGYARAYDAVVDEVVLTAAIDDMRDARMAANALGAFTSVETPAVAGQLSLHNPLELGDGPTRSQFTILLNNVEQNGQAVEEVNALRAGLDVKVYSDTANAFYYIESGLSMLGMSFPIMNVGVDGAEVSVKMPLIYDRYFTADVNDVFDEIGIDFGEYVDYFTAQHRQRLAAMNNLAEAMENTMDFEVMLIDMFADLHEVAEVYVNGNELTLTIPASYATDALGVIWNAVMDVYAMLDVSAFNGDFEEEWANVLADMRDALDYIFFTRDVVLVYVLEDGVITSMAFEGFIREYGTYSYEMRLAIDYTNNSGDHVGDIAWVFEIEPVDYIWPEIIIITYASTLDTSRGYYSRTGISMSYTSDNPSINDINREIGWYVDRAANNSFSAGLEFTVDDNGAFNLFAQGSMTHGAGYFAFDVDRFGLNSTDGDDSFCVELSAFFLREAIDRAALPAIDPASQFFAMDACDDEFDRVMEQVEENIEGLASLFSGLGF